MRANREVGNAIKLIPGDLGARVVGDTLCHRVWPFSVSSRPSSRGRVVLAGRKYYDLLHNNCRICTLRMACDFETGPEDGSRVALLTREHQFNLGVQGEEMRIREKGFSLIELLIVV